MGADRGNLRKRYLEQQHQGYEQRYNYDQLASYDEDEDTSDDDGDVVSPCATESCCRSLFSTCS